MAKKFQCLVWNSRSPAISTQYDTKVNLNRQTSDLINEFTQQKAEFEAKVNQFTEENVRLEERLLENQFNNSSYATKRGQKTKKRIIIRKYELVSHVSRCHIIVQSYNLEIFILQRLSAHTTC